MCGRFAISATPEEIAAHFALAEIDDFPARYNIAPSQPILVVIAANQREEGSNLPARRTLLARWGLIPAWTRDPLSLPLHFNARSETALEKASFRAAMRHRRVLVPASGFYEWRRDGKRKPRPYWIQPKNGGILAFGGIFETFAEPGGSEVDTAAILTTAANGDIAHIHDRMPVVIGEESFGRWLDCRGQEPREVVDLMQPSPTGMLEAIPVSDRINKAANMGADLQNPADEEPEQAPPEPRSGSTETQLKLL